MTDHVIPAESIGWDAALLYAYEEGYLTRPQMEALQQSNPYRTTK